MTGCYVSESCSHNNESGRFRSASIPHAGTIGLSDDFLSSFLLNGRNAASSSVSTRISPYSSISGSCFRFLGWDQFMSLLGGSLEGLAYVIHQDAARVLAAACMSLHHHLLILTNTICFADRLVFKFNQARIRCTIHITKDGVSARG